MVGDLQKKSFLEPQAAGIDGGQENEIMKSGNLAQNAVDFLSGQNGGQSFFRWRFNDLEQIPVALHDMKVEKLDGAVTDAHGVGLPFVDVLAMNEVPLELLLGDLVGFLAVEEFNELAHMPGIGFLGSFSFAVQF